MPVDPVRDEAQRLVAAAVAALSLAARGLGGAAAFAKRRAAGGDDSAAETGAGGEPDPAARPGFATGRAECCICPICRVITAMREPSPDLVDRITAGAGDLAAGVVGLLRSLFRPVSRRPGWADEEGYPESEAADEEGYPESDRFAGFTGFAEPDGHLGDADETELAGTAAPPSASAGGDTPASDQPDDADPWQAATVTRPYPHAAPPSGPLPPEVLAGRPGYTKTVNTAPVLSEPKRMAKKAVKPAAKKDGAGKDGAGKDGPGKEREAKAAGPAKAGAKAAGAKAAGVKAAGTKAAGTKAGRGKKVPKPAASDEPPPTSAAVKKAAARTAAEQAEPGAGAGR